MRIILFLFFSVVIAVAGYFAYIKYLNPDTIDVTKVNEIKIFTSNQSELNIEVEQIRSISKQPKNIDQLEYYGWIPDWDMVSGFETLQNNTFIKNVSAFWFDLNENGTLKTNLYTNWDDLIYYTQDNNINLIPTITSFDKDKLSSVLNSQENIDRFIEETIDYVVTYGYAGIDLDFELFYINDQKLFLEMLRTLKSRLAEHEKILQFSALAKWGDHISYSQSKATLDYKKMGEIVDQFIIQGYSYTIHSSDHIGAIGPIDWLEDVIRYAIKSGIPREKLILGIHTYAIDWPERAIEYDLTYYSESGLSFTPSESENGVAYYHNGIDKLFDNYEVTTKFIENWGEMMGEYDYGGVTRVVVWPNNESIQLRKQLAADYGIKGIAYWRLGDEGSLQL